MSSLRVCMAGTWDPNFHRNRALRNFLERAGCEVAVSRVDLWGKREDAVVRTGKLRVVLRAIVAYPLLAWRFLRTRRPDIVLVPYPGHFDVPVLALLCKLRGIPIVFDIFISLFDTVVSDRALAEPGSVLARILLAADRIACRRADLILADTPPHADFLSELTGVSRDRFRIVWVGAEERVFHPRPASQPDPERVLFYGTFIRLHGVETIVHATKALEPDGIQVCIIGDGQEGPMVSRLVDELKSTNLERIGFMPLERLAEEIAGAAICLGIFGSTGKADRVVPNKVFQCVAMGRPVVTGDTAAIRAAFDDGEIVTVPVGDGPALAAAVRSLYHRPEERERIAQAGRRRFARDYSEKVLGAGLRTHLEELLTQEGATVPR